MPDHNDLILKKMQEVEGFNLILWCFTNFFHKNIWLNSAGIHKLKPKIARNNTALIAWQTGVISHILSCTAEYNLPKEEIYSSLHRLNCVNIWNSRKILNKVV